MEAAKDTYGLARAAVVLGTALLVTLPVLLVLEHMVIIGVAGGALGLVVLRMIFMWMAPWLSHHSVLVADIVNALIYFCRAVFFFLELTEDVLADLLDAIESIGKEIGLDPGLPHLGRLGASFDRSAAVSADAVHAALTEVIRDCVEYDEAWKIVWQAVKIATHEWSCAAVRYTYPVPWLAALAEPVLGGFYDNSADPVSSHDALGNCEVSLNGANTTHMSCVAIGSGYVLGEIFLPLLLAALALVALWPGIWGLVWAAAEVIGLVAEWAWKYCIRLVLKYAL
jgi:hypothetical protein